ncbi:hypothetical protein CCYA_CCYA18G4480 [Cyanidiococcus yangmingshanensis]|nr:hypothetical protein CCYA_CCYA18G4480 [Cyanidiococcus yangmingshanensis]
MQTQRFARRLLERHTGRWWRGAKTKAKKSALSENRAETGVTSTNAPTERSREQARTWSALNIIKGGTGPPKQPLSAYPDWLWTLLAPENNLPLRTLRQRFEALAAQGGIANAELKLGHKATQRLLKLQNRADIKMRNLEGTLM